METSLIIAGIGLKDMDECLGTVYQNPLPNEIIVVIDDVGRSLSPIKNSYKVEDIIQRKYPEVKIFYNRDVENWNMTNQTFNIGIKKASSEYVMLTHEDVLFPKFDYFKYNLDELIQNYFSDYKCKFVGVTFPYEQLLGTAIHFYVEEIERSTYSPLTTIIKKSCIEEIGYLDEVDGNFYDVFISAEMKLRNSYFINIPAPFMGHKVSRSLQATNNANGFRLSPKWEHVMENFERKYGTTLDENTFSD